MRLSWTFYLKSRIIDVQGGDYMILDLILILLFIIVAVIGYKVGFLTTLIKLTSTLSGIIIAICFTKPITTAVVDWGWDSAIETKVYNNIVSSEAFVAYTEGGEGVEGISSLLQELGLPSFISGFVASGLVDTIDPIAIAEGIANGVSYVLVFMIVFVVLLLFSSIGFLILKLFVKTVRKSVGFIRVIDGIAGIIFFFLMFMLVIYIGFLIVSLMLQSAPADSDFVLFFEEQLHLNDDTFGLAKYIYKNNMIGNFLGLIF
jgi:uncharacterized membrane protein required for colicin V production